MNRRPVAGLLDLADAAGDFEAVDVGQHDVEQHHVRRSAMNWSTVSAPVVAGIGAMPIRSR